MSSASSNVSCPVAADLTSTTAAAYRLQIEQKMAAATKEQPGWSLLELDLRAARMVDSVGLNLLVSIIKSVKEKGGNVRLLISHPNIQRILAFTRIDKHAEVKLI